MQVLAYGQKLPESGDQGSVWFSALEDNITRIDAHTHDGTDSPRLSAASFTAEIDTAAAIDWVATSGGTYRQLITMPVGFLYDDYSIGFKHGTDGHQLYLSCEKLNTTQFYVYINDNSIPVTILYGA